ncbi:MAG: 2'-5' RNA ligase family protein [Ardenticatenaceae bacterium]|nr:2'-5' RNA ligase family protein [Ardenticatenaceae bacterium]
MHGIVSLLDDQHTEFVEKLWAEMAQRFGVGNPAATFVPHFSYHVAEAYDLDRLAGILERLAKETAVFPIQAAGIAIFPGAESVIYVPVARSLALTQLHERVWTAVNPHSQGSIPYYAPAVWFPHITLAHGDITPENLGPIVTWLHTQSIAWTIQVDNLALVAEGNGRHQINHRFPFSQK